MTLQVWWFDCACEEFKRYEPNEPVVDSNAWVTASNAEAEIAKVDRASKWLMKEHAKECCKYEAEIAALKKRVQELEAELKAKPRLEEESCDNCKYAGKRLSDYPCNICDETDDRWEPQQ